MLNEDGFIISKAKRAFTNTRASLASIPRVQKPIDYFTPEELATVPTGDLFVFDTESYRNFWFIAFKHIKSGKVVTFEDSPGSTVNVNALRWMLWRFCIVGFNSRTYDVPMTALALTGMHAAELKEASDKIIYSELRAYQFEKEFKVNIPNVNHIDLIEVAPLQASLKTYAGRLHCERMQDLPFEVEATLSEEEAQIVREYCVNDLDNTILLFEELAPWIKLRTEMSGEYGVDLRSKSDAQLAEAVINAELAKLTGNYPRKPTLSADFSIQYQVPSFIRFQTPLLQKTLSDVAEAVFYLDGLGAPMMPKTLEKYVVTIGGTTYKLGMGGLHSQESKAAYVATDEMILSDNDVESYYPRIILNQRLAPLHLGEDFLTVYESIVNRRIQAKRDKNKVVADSLKITINGSFGKFGNKYSTLYAPQLLLQVTITGQLSLLMLIEMLELAGIRVVSGNTDGIVIYYNKARHEDVRAIIAEWERITQYKTEETRYKAIYSRDVNNYIAIKEDDTCKLKGIYSELGSALNSRLSKNPEVLICSDAVQAFLTKGTPIEKTISECRDITRFTTLRNVKGGAQKNGVYLGKVVRWYYARKEYGAISYVTTGNKVPKSDGGKPLMDLPAVFPDDVNYDWYIKEATDMLYDLGRYRKAETGSLFF